MDSNLPSSLYDGRYDPFYQGVVHHHQVTSGDLGEQVSVFSSVPNPSMADLAIAPESVFVNTIPSTHDHQYFHEIGVSSSNVVPLDDHGNMSFIMPNTAATSMTFMCAHDPMGGSSSTAVALDDHGNMSSINPNTTNSTTYGNVQDQMGGSSSTTLDDRRDGNMSTFINPYMSINISCNNNDNSNNSASAPSNHDNLILLQDNREFQWGVSGSRNHYPNGYRFSPTDSELVIHYLRNKVSGRPLPNHPIPEVDLYACSPTVLTCIYPLEHATEWYFFTKREKKYPKGKQPSRFVKDHGSMHWRITGKTEAIVEGGVEVGYKRVLDLYHGPKNRSDWNMHEYMLTKDEDCPMDATATKLDVWVLCKIYINSRIKKKARE